MPISSIPRIAYPKERASKPQRRGTVTTATLCLLLAVYIGFIAFNLVKQEATAGPQAVPAQGAVTIEDRNESGHHISVAHAQNELG